MKSSLRPFPSLAAILVLALALLIPGFARAATDADNANLTVISAAVDDDTAACVKEFIVPGMTAAELLSKGFRADRVVKNEDGSVVQVYKNVRYVITRGGPDHGLPVRIEGGLGFDLAVKLVAGRVQSWRLGG